VRSSPQPQTRSLHHRRLRDCGDGRLPRTALARRPARRTPPDGGLAHARRGASRTRRL